MIGLEKHLSLTKIKSSKTSPQAHFTSIFSMLKILITNNRDYVLGDQIHKFKPQKVLMHFQVPILSDYAFPFLNYTERERIEAQIKAADMALRLKAEAEKKQQRERDREAARIALQKVIHRLFYHFYYGIYYVM